MEIEPPLKKDGTPLKRLALSPTYLQQSLQHWHDKLSGHILGLFNKQNAKIDAQFDQIMKKLDSQHEYSLNELRMLPPEEILKVQDRNEAYRQRINKVIREQLLHIVEPTTDKQQAILPPPSDDDYEEF
jgi:hypothetical protein